MDSVWMTRRDAAASFDILQGDLEADAVVIGGGITGVTAAQRLHEDGLRVVLLEGETIAASNTGGSTGNLYGTVSHSPAELVRKWGASQVRLAVAARLAAIDAIEANVQRHGLSCEFARQPLYWMTAARDEGSHDTLEDERIATEQAGLAPVRLDASELVLGAAAGFRLDGQAQFNPYEYTRQLAEVLRGRGVRIFERSPVVDIDASEGRVVTSTGQVVARSIVIATHSPIGFNLVQAQMEPIREYGVSMTPGASAVPEGILWVRDQGRSVRRYADGANDYVIVVGEKHKTGEPVPGVDYLARLRTYAAHHFPGARPAHEWSAQQFRSADGLPYIGRSAHDNVYIATGFAADGLVWGTAAASLIAGLIAGRDDETAQLLTPRRFTPLKSAKVWATENATVVKHLVGDRVRRIHAELTDVAPGEGRIVSVDGDKVAAYRADDGRVTLLSPVCPHLKCHVAWNGEARSWDCPCHGSRFHADGRVMEGPAKSSLEPIEPD